MCTQIKSVSQINSNSFQRSVGRVIVALKSGNGFVFVCLWPSHFTV